MTRLESDPTRTPMGRPRALQPGAAYHSHLFMARDEDDALGAMLDSLAEYGLTLSGARAHFHSFYMRWYVTGTIAERVGGRPVADETWGDYLDRGGHSPRYGPGIGDDDGRP